MSSRYFYATLLLNAAILLCDFNPRIQQHNCFSDSTQYSGNFVPIVHEYLLLVRKDNPLIYQMLCSQKEEMDLRDMRNATWRDIVADAMEEFGDAVGLEQIYAKVGQHKRTSTQRYWQDKVRQTLQYNPNTFTSPQRGVWSLLKHAS